MQNFMPERCSAGYLLSVKKEEMDLGRKKYRPKPEKTGAGQERLPFILEKGRKFWSRGMLLDANDTNKKGKGRYFVHERI